MVKDAFYFPHFSNARNDRKIMRLRMNLSHTGYSVYFMILEVLREQNDFKYPLKDLDLLAFEFDVEISIINSIVTDYELFEYDDFTFFSPRLNEFMEPYLKMKNQRREAGIASANKRKFNENSTEIEQSFNDRSTTVQQSKVKESKVKESKVNKVSKESFQEMIEPFANSLFSEYDKFLSYWTEKNKSGKERWECEKFFDIQRRINTWMQNSQKFSPAPFEKNNQENLVKGKIQSNFENIQSANQKIKQQIKDGNFKNPFSIE